MLADGTCLIGVGKAVHFARSSAVVFLVSTIRSRIHFQRSSARAWFALMVGS